MLRLIPLFLVTSLGMVGIVIFSYYAWIDWVALQVAYERFAEVTKTSTDFATLFAAESQQNIHRINLFAEGVWTIQCAVCASIGLHGLCTGQQRVK